MMSRVQITLDPETHRRVRKRAAEMGVSFAEYIRNLVATELDSARQTTDPSILFGLGRSEGSDIARNKDAMIAAALDAPPRRSGRPRRSRHR